jgi:mono/diheme cytochrome c family protein
MKTGITLSLALITASALAAQDPAPSPPVPPAETLRVAAGPDLGEASLGEAIYIRYCAACHGRSLKGDGPVAPGLVNKPIDLTVLAAKNRGSFPYDKVAAMIDGRQTTRMHGTPDMPVWGEIFAITAGTDAPTAEAAVKRITHYVWAHQAKPKQPAGK